MTKLLSFRVAPFLFDCIEARRNEVNLPTVGDYFKSLARADIILREGHIRTAGIIRLHPEEQARIDGRLSRAYIAGDLNALRRQFEAIDALHPIFKEAA